MLQSESLGGASVSGGLQESGQNVFAFLGILHSTNNCCVYMCLLRFDAEQCFSRAASDFADLNSLCKALAVEGGKKTA